MNRSFASCYSSENTTKEKLRWGKQIDMHHRKSWIALIKNIKNSFLVEKEKNQFYFLCQTKVHKKKIKNNDDDDEAKTLKKKLFGNKKKERKKIPLPKKKKPKREHFFFLSFLRELIDIFSMDRTKLAFGKRCRTLGVGFPTTTTIIIINDNGIFGNDDNSSIKYWTADLALFFFILRKNSQNQKTFQSMASDWRLGWQWSQSFEALLRRIFHRKRLVFFSPPPSWVRKIVEIPRIFITTFFLHRFRWFRGVPENFFFLFKTHLCFFNQAVPAQIRCTTATTNIPKSDNHNYTRKIHNKYISISTQPATRLLGENDDILHQPNNHNHNNLENHSNKKNKNKKTKTMIPKKNNLFSLDYWRDDSIQREKQVSKKGKKKKKKWKKIRAFFLKIIDIQCKEMAWVKKFLSRIYIFLFGVHFFSITFLRPFASFLSSSSLDLILLLLLLSLSISSFLFLSTASFSVVVHGNRGSPFGMKRFFRWIQQIFLSFFFHQPSKSKFLPVSFFFPLNKENKLERQKRLLFLQQPTKIDQWSFPFSQQKHQWSDFLDNFQDDGCEGEIVRKQEENDGRRRKRRGATGHPRTTMMYDPKPMGRDTIPFLFVSFTKKQKQHLRWLKILYESVFLSGSIGFRELSMGSTVFPQNLFFPLKTEEVVRRISEHTVAPEMVRVVVAAVERALNARNLPEHHRQENQDQNKNYRPQLFPESRKKNQQQQQNQPLKKWCFFLPIFFDRGRFHKHRTFFHHWHSGLLSMGTELWGERGKKGRAIFFFSLRKKKSFQNLFLGSKRNWAREKKKKKKKKTEELGNFLTEIPEEYLRNILVSRFYRLHHACSSFAFGAGAKESKVTGVHVPFAMNIPWDYPLDSNQQPLTSTKKQHRPGGKKETIGKTNPTSTNKLSLYPTTKPRGREGRTQRVPGFSINPFSPNNPLGGGGLTWMKKRFLLGPFFFSFFWDGCSLFSVANKKSVRLLVLLLLRSVSSLGWWHREEKNESRSLALVLARFWRKWFSLFFFHKNFFLRCPQRQRNFHRLRLLQMQDGPEGVSLAGKEDQTTSQEKNLLVLRARLVKKKKKMVNWENGSFLLPRQRAWHKIIKDVKREDKHDDGIKRHERNRWCGKQNKKVCIFKKRKKEKKKKKGMLFFFLKYSSHRFPFWSMQLWYRFFFHQVFIVRPGWVQLFPVTASPKGTFQNGPERKNKGKNLIPSIRHLYWCWIFMQVPEKAWPFWQRIRMENVFPPPSGRKNNRPVSPDFFHPDPKSLLLGVDFHEVSREKRGSVFTGLQHHGSLDERVPPFFFSFPIPPDPGNSRGFVWEPRTTPKKEFRYNHLVLFSSFFLTFLSTRRPRKTLVSQNFKPDEKGIQSFPNPKKKRRRDGNKRNAMMQRESEKKKKNHPTFWNPTDFHPGKPGCQACRGQFLQHFFPWWWNAGYPLFFFHSIDPIGQVCVGENIRLERSFFFSSRPEDFLIHPFSLSSKWKILCGWSKETKKQTPKKK